MQLRGLREREVERESSTGMGMQLRGLRERQRERESSTGVGMQLGALATTSQHQRCWLVCGGNSRSCVHIVHIVHIEGFPLGFSLRRTKTKQPFKKNQQVLASSESLFNHIKLTFMGDLTKALALHQKFPQLAFFLSITFKSEKAGASEPILLEQGRFGEWLIGLLGDNWSETM